MKKMSLPVACSLTEAELQERRSSILQKLRPSVVEVNELSEGYAYRFPPDDALIAELAQLVSLERRCCPFLRFGITVEPGGGPVWLEMSGPQGTKDFLVSVFN
jgi:hypothetical protein